MASDVLPDPLGPQKTVIWSRGRLALDRLEIVLLRTLDGQLRGLLPRPRRFGASDRACGPRAAAMSPPGPSPAPVRYTTPRSRPPLRACPATITRPPASPPSGPRSITQSAVLMTSRLCSTTSTVLPASTKSCSTFSSSWMSAKCKPGGRFVQQVERLARAAFDQFARQLDPLRFAAGERRRGLAQLQIVEPDVVQRLQLVLNLGDVLEQVQRLLNVHLQHFGNRLALELDLQRLAVVAMSFADRAGHPDVGQEVHLQAIRAVSFARLAAAAFDVETESSRLVAAPFRLGQLGEQVANVVEDLDVGARIGTRRAADRRLVDGDQLVEMLQPFDALVSRRARRYPPLRSRRSASTRMSLTSELLPDPETPVTQTNMPERDFDVDVLQVVVRRADHAQPRRVALRRRRRRGNLQSPLPPGTCR